MVIIVILIIMMNYLLLLFIITLSDSFQPACDVLRRRTNLPASRNRPLPCKSAPGMRALASVALSIRISSTKQFPRFLRALDTSCCPFTRTMYGTYMWAWRYKTGVAVGAGWPGLLAQPASQLDGARATELSEQAFPPRACLKTERPFFLMIQPNGKHSY